MARKKEMCSSENHEPGAGIVLMKLEELHSFEGHPFKVERNQELFELRCSIEKEGVLVPLLVRKNPHGDGYEIIAGHRRKEAALWAGLTEVPVIIRELDDDQSVIAMVDSNLQREKILPSEKAFAYKMRLEAMKHQGRAEADTSDPLEAKCKTELVNVSELEAELQKLGKVKIQKKGGAEGKRSNEQLASMVGESVTQIKRYIRLTHLIPKILDMVDKEILAIRSAVEISFLSEEEQYELHAVMELEQSIPNISQANRLKRMILDFYRDKLTETAIYYLGIFIIMTTWRLVGEGINTCLICGCFRGGGDSRFGMIIDSIFMWLVAVPLTFLAAYVLKLPPVCVYFVMTLDEFEKMPVVFIHYIRGKWLTNITRDFE